jgi:hypothetical protein
MLECAAQRGVPLSDQQVVLGCRGVLIREGLITSP